MIFFFFQAGEHLKFLDNLMIRKPEFNASVCCLTLFLLLEILRSLVETKVESWNQYGISYLMAIVVWWVDYISSAFLKPQPLISLKPKFDDIVSHKIKYVCGYKMHPYGVNFRIGSFHPWVIRLCWRVSCLGYWGKAGSWREKSLLLPHLVNQRAATKMLET